MARIKVRRLTEDELKNVLRATNDLMLRLMILICYYHGLRASEVCGLTGKAIRDGYLDVQRLKGSLRTRQPYIVRTDLLLDESRPLTALAAKVGDTDHLFPDTDRFWLYYRFNVAAKKAGLPPGRRNPHVLKHSCGMKLIKQGFEYAKDWMGHANASSTGAYLNPPEDETFAAAKTAFGS